MQWIEDNLEYSVWFFLGVYKKKRGDNIIVTTGVVNGDNDIVVPPLKFNMCCWWRQYHFHNLVQTKYGLSTTGCM